MVVCVDVERRTTELEELAHRRERAIVQLEGERKCGRTRTQRRCLVVSHGGECSRSLSKNDADTFHIEKGAYCKRFCKTYRNIVTCKNTAGVSL